MIRITCLLVFIRALCFSSSTTWLPDFEPGTLNFELFAPGDQSGETRTQSLLTSVTGLLQIAPVGLKETVLVSEDRVNLKRHSVILPVQSSYAVFSTTLVL
jgi:hypothetical protein